MPGCFVADERGIGFIRLVGRQHVVVGGDDANVGRALHHHFEFVLPRQGGKGMCHIGASHAVAATGALGCLVDPLEIVASCAAAVFNDSGCDFFEG
jgi:hypothetical protein